MKPSVKHQSQIWRPATSNEVCITCFIHRVTDSLDTLSEISSYKQNHSYPGKITQFYVPNNYFFVFFLFLCFYSLKNFYCKVYMYTKEYMKYICIVHVIINNTYYPPHSQRWWLPVCPIETPEYPPSLICLPFRILCLQVMHLEFYVNYSLDFLYVYPP